MQGRDAVLKMLRGLGWTVAGLLVLLAVVWSASRMWPVPEARLEARQRLETPLPAQGADGFALLWTLPFDTLQAAEREQALAEDVRRWNAAAPGKGRQSSHLADDHPLLAPRAEASCGPTGDGCLAQVRADPQRFIDAHAGHEGLHARLARLAAAERFESPFRPTSAVFLVPVPAYGLVLDATSAHALAYVQGDIEGALHGACQGLQLGRRLLPGGGTLLDSSVGTRLLQSNAQLLADMLVELPADHPLPPACAQAMQPLAAQEQSLCRAMQGEFAMGRASIESSAQEWAGVLVLDRPATLARMAGNLGWACGEAATRALADDRPLQVPAPAQRDFGCLANMMGCVLTDIAGPVYPAYAARAQDAAAQVRLLAAQRWLRQQQMAPAQALAQLPAAYGSTVRRPQLSADGRRLQVPRRSPAQGRGEDVWLSVPLQPAAPSSAAAGE